MKLPLFSVAVFATSASGFVSRCGPSSASVGFCRAVASRPFSSTVPLKMSGDMVDFVKSEVASNDVVVFSKSTCPFCAKTKASLKELDIDAKIIELNKVENGFKIQSALGEVTGQKTVPNVFVKGTHIGGNDDTQAAIASGKLQKMLQ